jgi:hypothetical protein
MPLKIRGRWLLAWLNGFALLFPNEDSALRAHPSRAICAIRHRSTGAAKREVCAIAKLSYNFPKQGCGVYNHNCPGFQDGNLG